MAPPRPLPVTQNPSPLCIDRARGPRGEKRPADVIGNAIKVARIATGEEEEVQADDGKDKAAVSLGRRGGKARAASLSKKQRTDIAKKAASSRWTKS